MRIGDAVLFRNIYYLTKFHYRSWTVVQFHISAGQIIMSLYLKIDRAIFIEECNNHLDKGIRYQWKIGLILCFNG